ncbi:dTMP kinase [bacterium]|nr:dTMP kinase [bacterium]
MKREKGFFITFEGIDGTGKTTQSKLLEDYLAKKGYSVLLTYEPGGTEVGERIRDLLLHSRADISSMTELLLYEASRAQLVEEVIRPALAEDRTVICDRFTDATLAYQGYGRGLKKETIGFLNEEVTKEIMPDLTFYLDIAPNDKFSKEEIKDRLEREALSFHRRVREGYLSLARSDPGRIKIIRANQPAEKVGKIIQGYAEQSIVSRQP